MAPKKKRNEMKHSNIICLRLSDIELELVNHAASQAKLSRSDYLRNLILDHKMAIHYEVVIDTERIFYYDYVWKKIKTFETEKSSHTKRTRYCTWLSGRFC